MNLKFNQLFNVFASMMVVICIYFAACTKQNTKEDNAITAKIPEVFYSKEEVSSLKSWVTNQSLVDDELRMDNFPKLSFYPQVSSSDSALIAFYTNGIMYINDDIHSGKKADYETIISMISADNRLDRNGKILLLSTIQLYKEVSTAPEVIEFYKTAKRNEVALRGGCDCSTLKKAYNAAALACTQGNNLSCISAGNLKVALRDCNAQTPTICPNGFSFDGANCYSGLHFPSGYSGFVWGNGFYTSKNCNISTSNDCCPPGFGFDGANCHYWGLYFPTNYTAFIWNNTFYLKPKCQF